MKTVKFTEKFIKDYNENSNVKYITEVGINYPKKLSALPKELKFIKDYKFITKKNVFVI